MSAYNRVASARGSKHKIAYQQVTTNTAQKTPLFDCLEIFQRSLKKDFSFVNNPATTPCAPQTKTPSLWGFSPTNSVWSSMELSKHQKRTIERTV